MPKKIHPDTIVPVGPPPEVRPAGVAASGVRLEGFNPGLRGQGSGTEFSEVIADLSHDGTRTVTYQNRRFEFTGQFDADGRRIYRDHTRY